MQVVELPIAKVFPRLDPLTYSYRWSAEKHRAWLEGAEQPAAAAE